MLIVQAPNSRVVRTIKPDNEILGLMLLKNLLDWPQNLLQRFCAKLGRSTCAGGHAGEADLFAAHTAWFHSPPS